MVYRRNSGVQGRLKAISNQSNVKAMKVCIVLIIRRFVFQVQKNTFQGKIHTHIIAMQCVISEHDCLLQNSLLGS